MRALTEVFTRTYEDEYEVLTKVFTRTYEDEYEVLTKVFTRTYEDEYEVLTLILVLLQGSPLGRYSCIAQGANPGLIIETHLLSPKGAAQPSE